jgi:hypothetical protein
MVTGLKPRQLVFVVAMVIPACFGMRGVSHDTRRPISATPTPLMGTGEIMPPGAGGGTYDGAERVVFDVVAGGQTPAKLYVARHSSAGWSAPTPAIPGFDAWHASAQLSPDGTRLYFESTFRAPAVPGREDSDVWVAERIGDAWGNARPVGPPFDAPYNEHGVTISAHATICINSNRRGVTAGHDIMCARRSNGGWEVPLALDTAVNSPAAEIAPFLDPAERFLIFSSNRPGGAGAFDLYLSVKRGSRWLPAVTLDSAVNSAASESNPAVSPDGRRLLFTRTLGERVVLHEVRFNPRWLQSER